MLCNYAAIGAEVCRLIPALSLLKDGKMYKHQHREFYENVRACFEIKEGAAGMSMHKDATLLVGNLTNYSIKNLTD